ncbi:hypothetical protein OKW40_000192 [Paraburkholderia sp. RAU6.4a]|nr:hypothetical protein [Paraburkholderia sp. HC6.4b]MBB5452002.1 hypothetical protein [Paraburkholderia sp. Kb1A]
MNAQKWLKLVCASAVVFRLPDCARAAASGRIGSRGTSCGEFGANRGRDQGYQPATRAGRTPRIQKRTKPGTTGQQHYSARG